LLAEAPGCLLAEGGVLGPEPGDLLVCGVQAGAQGFGAGPLGGPGAGCPCWFGAQPGDQVAGAGVAVEPGPGDSAAAAAALKVTGWPELSSSLMAWLALASAAWARNQVLSARVIGGLLGAGVDGLEGGDDLFQVLLDLAEAGGQPGLAVGLGPGDQPQIGGGLAAVDVEKLRRGLKVWAGQAGVGV
jgi:hypothetical protein